MRKSRSAKSQLILAEVQLRAVTSFSGRLHGHVAFRSILLRMRDIQIARVHIPAPSHIYASQLWLQAKLVEHVLQIRRVNITCPVNTNLENHLVCI